MPIPGLSSAKGARTAPFIFIKQPLFQADVAADGVSFQLFLPIGNIVVPARGTRERQARSIRHGRAVTAAPRLERSCAGCRRTPAHRDVVYPRRFAFAVHGLAILALVVRVLTS